MEIFGLELFKTLKREFIYLEYYFEIQLFQILPYWIMGMFLGSIISIFGKAKIHDTFASMGGKKWGILGVVPASILGILSPLCMYGTIPMAAAFSKKGMKDDWLAAFMMSSILLNPQLIIYSTALGETALVIRILSCFICGITAGVLINYFYRGQSFFNFSNFSEPVNRDTDPNIFLRFLKNFYRNIKATGKYFLVGVILSVLFQRYVPADILADLFGKSNEGFGVLMAATVGVPLYVCGGGTIPLLVQWLASGMSMGSAAAFMITGPATKITNLGAVKIVLGGKKFVLYLAFIIIFSYITGIITNIFI